ncbi:hypothetical protein NDI56_03985 [Haloarcula sp. S1CR25-12]|uniref:HK97 gp10 family phage protein n=1 Tax=Haloarcula saliterrae TaxID=2950534 RepID=A0ABU2F8H1_9EURY|nr:hypothetical protein [Haloarcula sp. S1CR25-12]MDS0258570.1 hypothetical protein [Haloarcula sp. S1CR25-12]
MNLESSFEDDLQEAVLDDVERQLVGERDNLVAQAVQRVQGRLERYAREEDYDVEPIVDSFAGVEVDRSDGQLTIRWGWSHPAVKYFEFGTSDHTVEGDPVLSFVWERSEAPDWVAEEFDEEGDGYRVFLPEVEVSGVEETRAIRDSINWLRRAVS